MVCCICPDDASKRHVYHVSINAMFGIFFNLWHFSGDMDEDQANEFDLQTYNNELQEGEEEGEADEEGEGDDRLEDLEPFQGSQGSPLNDLDCSSESPTSPTLPPGQLSVFGKIFSRVSEGFFKGGLCISRCSSDFKTFLCLLLLYTSFTLIHFILAKRWLIT